MSPAPRGAPLQRVEELAESAGSTVRNIRVYQEKGLLPPPIRRGRTALYGPEHRRRLTLILRLLDRGYTFATIDELFTAERHGLSLTDLIEAENSRALRRSGGARRRFTRTDAEAVAGFPMPPELLEMGTAIGLVSEPGADDEFFADAHMYEMFREVVRLGLDAEGVTRIGDLVLEGQARSAEAIDVVVRALREAGLDDARIEERVNALLPSASAAVRRIFLSAVAALLAERHGITRP